MAEDSGQGSFRGPEETLRTRGFRTTIWLRGCDTLTEGLLYFMVVFSPWAFGTTQEWSQRVMNLCGYSLGALWMLKWLGRAAGSRKGRKVEPAPRTGRGAVATWGMAILTVLILAYTLISALNARATYIRAEYRFDYHECVAWLPHSMDSVGTWQAFWTQLALALAFWAARDWLLGGAHQLGDGSGCVLPARMKRLLWVLCVNGGLLALEGVLQRGSGTNRLLWLVEPRLNNTADAQFGPYAYRSNGAQYLTLLWPVALGFWWVSQHAAGGKGRSRSRQHLLIPCAVTMAAAPLISLSRAGAIIGLAAMMTAGVLLIFAQGGSGWKGRLAFTALLGAVLGLGWYAIWPEMSKRVGPAGKEFEEGRLDVWRRALEMRRDYALFGSGPNTFEPVYQFYSPQLKEGDWPAQLHNDWLEMLITFGSVGFSLILLLLMLALGRWFLGGGIHSHRVFVMFLWLGLGATLAHGAVDFPFRIYSIFFLFLIVCAVLSCLGRRHRG